MCSIASPTWVESSDANSNQVVAGEEMEKGVAREEVEEGREENEKEEEEEVKNASNNQVRIWRPKFRGIPAKPRGAEEEEEVEEVADDDDDDDNEGDEEEEEGEEWQEPRDDLEVEEEGRVVVKGRRYE